MSVRHGAFLDRVDQFDPQFFNIPPREAVSIDPQHRLLLEVSWEALERAAIVPGQLHSSRTGVFVAMMHAGEYAQLLARSASQDMYAATGNGYCFASGRLSYALGLQGPSVVVDTACSASLVAVHQASYSLRAGECDTALVGSVNLMLTPDATITISQLQALSPDGRCKTFDAAADGFGRGEGCGVIVLKRLSDAVAAEDNILAVIRGSAVNHGGASGGFTVPSKSAQEQLIRDALSNSRVRPDEVAYVEAHGTGTSLGDPLEIHALADVFHTPGRSDPLWVGSVKTNIGHLEGTAGMAGMMKTILAFQHDAIPPHLHFHDPSPHIDWPGTPVRVPTEITPWPAAAQQPVAGVSSFGLGGTNAHVILQGPEASDASPVTPAVPERPWHLLNLSARSPAALTALAQKYVDFADRIASEDIDLADICYTANVARTHFDYRLSVVSDSVAHMRMALNEQIQSGSIASVQKNHQTTKSIAFLFTGQGSQYPGIGRELYATQPTFRAVLDQCDAILRPLLDGVSVLEIMNDQQTDRIHQTAYTQPTLFVLEVALAKLWSAWGIQPKVLIGHSVGEIAAACVAGVFSLEDGLTLVAARARLMQALPQQGAMVACLTDVTRVQSAIAEYSDEVSIAAVNGPTNVVISGATTAVQAIVEQLAAEHIRTRALTVSHAFHSPLMDPMLAEFRAVATRITYAEPTLPLISNLTGQLADATIATPDYWVRHVREAVQFADGMACLLAQGVDIFLEIGPKPVLLGMGQRCVPEDTGLWLPSIRPDQAWPQLLSSLGQLYRQGVTVDWQAFDQNYARRRVVLPTYSFQRERYWVDSSVAESLSRLRPLIDKMVRVPTHDETLFETAFSVQNFPFLNDHRVYGTVISPGACHLSVVLSAAELLSGTGDCLLEDIIFPQALVMPEDEARTVQAVCIPTEGAWMQFQLISFADSAQHLVHATGRLMTDQIEARSASPITLDDWREQCPTELSIDAVYQTAAEKQIVFGPCFRWLSRVWVGDGQAVARLDCPEVVGSLSGYVLHPGLLDACLQVTGAVEQNSDETRLPFAIQSIRVYGPATGQVWWCVSQQTDEDTSDIWLLDQNEHLLAEIRGFTVRAVPREALQSVPVWQNWLYQVNWQAQALPEVAATSEETHWLIVTATADAGAVLSDQIRSSGTRCTLLPLAELRLADHVAHSPALTDVVYLAQEDKALAVPEQTTELSGGLLHLVQGLIKQDITPRLWVITRNAQPVIAHESVNPVQSAVWGLVRTIAVEHPEFRCVALDYAEESDLSMLSGQLCTPDAETQLALRGTERYVARLHRWQPSDAVSVTEPPVIRAQATGSYVITGGLGGLGLQVAGQLVNAGARHLVLAGRRNPSAVVADQIRCLEADGAEIQVVQADISVADDVARLLAACPQPLRGVVHAAGVLDDAGLSQQTTERLATVMGPKVQGGWHLHCLTADQALDFFVCFSSIAALSGSRGQGNYAAANAFLDGLMACRQAQGLPGLSINWGAWAEVGMAANLAERERARLASQGLGLIQPEQGQQALACLLEHANGTAQIGVFPIDWKTFTAHDPTSHSFYADLSVSATTHQTVISARQQLSVLALAEREAFLLHHLRSTVAKVLGLSAADQVDPAKGLTDLGLDSLMAVELRNNLSRSLEISLPATLVFDYPNLNILQAHLMTELFTEQIPAADRTDSATDSLTEDELTDLFLQEFLQDD